MIYANNYKSLGVILTLYSSGRIIIPGSPLGSMTCPVTGSWTSYSDRHEFHLVEKALFKLSQKVVGYSHDSCTTIAPVGISCWPDTCSSQRSHLGKIDDYFCSLLSHIALSSTMITKLLGEYQLAYPSLNSLHYLALLCQFWVLLSTRFSNSALCKPRIFAKLPYGVLWGLWDTSNQKASGIFFCSASLPMTCSL